MLISFRTLYYGRAGRESWKKNDHLRYAQENGLLKGQHQEYAGSLPGLNIKEESGDWVITFPMEDASIDLEIPASIIESSRRCRKFIERVKHLESLLILESDNGLALYKLEDDKLRLWRPLPAKNTDPAAIDHKNGTLGIIDQRRKRASIYRIRATGMEPLAPPLALPAGTAARAIAVRADTLYAAVRLETKSASGKFWRMAVKDTRSSWKRVETPGLIDNWHNKKEIEAILLDEDRLFAVENSVPPQWNLVYNIREHAAPVFVSRHDIVSHTSDEHVDRAALGRHYLALLSNGRHHGNRFQFLSMYNTRTLQERYAFEMHTSNTNPSILFNSIAFAGDRLYFTTAAGGYGSIVTNQVNRKRGQHHHQGEPSPADTQSTVFIDWREESGKKNNTIERYSSPLGLKAYRVSTLPHQPGCCLSLRDDSGRYLHQWLPSAKEMRAFAAGDTH